MLSQFGESGRISFFAWFILATPLALLNLFLLWVILSLWFINPSLRVLIEQLKLTIGCGGDRSIAAGDVEPTDNLLASLRGLLNRAGGYGHVGDPSTHVPDSPSFKNPIHPSDLELTVITSPLYLDDPEKGSRDPQPGTRRVDSYEMGPDEEPLPGEEVEEVYLFGRTGEELVDSRDSRDPKDLGTLKDLNGPMDRSRHSNLSVSARSFWGLVQQSSSSSPSRHPREPVLFSHP
jgi:hypothetical protein